MKDAEKQLIDILSENRKLKEELGMKKFKENEANVDKQATPPQPVAKSDGTPLDSDKASQDDLASKYKENEAKTDTQVSPSQPVAAADGTKPTADEASQDDMKQKYPVEASKMEKVEADEKKAEEDDTKKEERFKEFEGDMTKVTDILEALKTKLESLEGRMAQLEGAGGQKPAAEPVMAAEPEPPMTESMQLHNVFVETVKTAESKDKFNKAMHEVIYK